MTRTSLPIVMLLGAAAVLGCDTPGDQPARTEIQALPPRDSLPTRPAIVFVGTSLTAGYGLDPSQAYPALIQAKLDTAGLPYRVVNAGVSGATSAAALGRIDWLLRQPVAVLVIEAGANDGLRGLDAGALRDNIQAMIDRTRATSPEVEIILVGMEAPPNYGRRYTQAFREVYADLARENGIPLVPFLLDGVAGIDSLNQADGIHPTAAGHRIIAGTVWKVLAPVLRDAAPR